MLVSEKIYYLRKERFPFNIDISKIIRNQTSPFVFHKTLNYGECIMEKRTAQEMKLDEMLFLNMNDEICEGTTCNIFFVKKNQLFTPRISSGLLPGIIRDYICRTYSVIEAVITPSQISEFDECFVTNSLLGIMPVHRLAEKIFVKRAITNQILNDYFQNVFVLQNPVFPI